MTCSDVQQLLPELLDGAPDAVFQTAFDSHVKSCPNCSELLSDLKLITSEARELAEISEPAPRIWVNIAAQLRAEGLIREPETVPARPILVPSSRGRRWNAWWLVPVAAALLAAGAYVIDHKPAPPVAQQGPAANPIAPANSKSPTANGAAETAAVDSHSTSVPPTTSMPASAVEQAVAESGKPGGAAKRELAPPPSADDQQFLSVVSTLAPSSRATYENELQAVNADIRETQAYVNQNPRDADARQHLMDAYQQKALLYQIALDRIQ